MSLAPLRHPGHARARGRPAGRLAAGLLVLLLLWAGTWAAWHRVAHAGHAGSGGLARSLVPPAQLPLGSAPASAPVAEALGSAQGSAGHAAVGHHGGHAPGGLDCQALDHGLGADTPPLSLPVWPVLAAARLLPQPPEPQRVLLRPRWAQPVRAPPAA